MTQSTIMDPKKKIEPEDVTLPMTTAGTTAIGDVLAVNPLLLSNGEFYAMRVALAVDSVWGRAGVAQSTGGNGAIIPYKFAGRCKAAVKLVSEALAIGDPLFLDATAGSVRALTSAATSGGATDTHTKVFAIAMEVVTSSTATVLVEVELQGIVGYGSIDHA